MLPASDCGTGRLPSVRGSSPDYRRQIVDTRAKLAELPDLYKLVAFDRNRRAMVTMAENVEKATRPQLAELVQLLVELVQAKGRTIEPESIEWPPPARPLSSRLRCRSAPGPTRGAREPKPLTRLPGTPWPRSPL